MEHLGTYLKTQRELRRVDLHSVADETKIAIRWLYDMEEDRWDNLPGKTFARGYVKSYATALGLDTDEVLTRYDDMVRLHHGDHSTLHSHLQPTRRNWRRFMPFLILLAIGLFFLIYWMT